MKRRAQTREISVGGVGGSQGGERLRLQALQYGSEGSARTLLLLHATSFCGAVWGPVLEAAPALPVRAVAPDARGHGASDAPAAVSGFAWTELVDDAVAWIDALEEAGLGGLVLAGHSSGATAALAAAARRPDRVLGVLAVEPVLFEPPPPGTDAEPWPGSRFLAAKARTRRARFASLAEARERLGAKPPYVGFAPASLDAFLEGGLGPTPDGAVTLCCEPEHEAACYEGSAAFDLFSALGGLRAPVRILLGERSFVAPPLLAKLVDALPRTRVERVAGGTHFVALEEPLAVGAALARFVREVATEDAD